MQKKGLIHVHFKCISDVLQGLRDLEMKVKQTFREMFETIHTLKRLMVPHHNIKITGIKTATKNNKKTLSVVAENSKYIRTKANVVADQQVLKV